MKIDKATVKDVAKDWVRDKMSVFETRKIIILFNNCHMANTSFACIGGRGMGELVSSNGTNPSLFISRIGHTDQSLFIQSFTQ